MKTELITQKEVTKADVLVLNPAQLNFILQKTPAKFIKKRPAKGGGEWSYVSVGYMTKVLNLMFGWDWNFEIVKEEIFLNAKEVVVKGRLTVTSNGKSITREQFGNKDIMMRKNSTQPLSIGNDLKAAASDSLKKCASMLGVAQDVYAPQEFKEVIVQTEVVNDIALNLCGCDSSEDVKMLWDSLSEADQEKYSKLFNALNKLSDVQ